MTTPVTSLDRLLSSAVLVLWLAWVQSAAAAVLNGIVVGVTDGDTVTVLDSSRKQHKVRLAGIDAPEAHQAFGQRSRQYLASLVFRQQLTVEWSKHDRFGRILGKVLLDGNDVNLKLVEAGLAWFYRQYAHEQSPSDAMRYADAENEAREKHIGLWTDAHAVAPWEWRKTNKARRGRPTGE